MNKSRMLVFPLFFILSTSCASLRDETKETRREASLQVLTVAKERIVMGREVPITGGLTGAMAGSAIGRYAYGVERNQSETNKEYGYAHDRGTAARIESATVTPRFTKPGDRIDLKVTYVVLTHSSEPTMVREIREIWYGENLWGSPEVQVERGGGTYESTIPLYLPDDLRPGTYKVRYIVRTPTSRDVREANFTVSNS